MILSSVTTNLVLHGHTVNVETLGATRTRDHRSFHVFSDASADQTHGHLRHELVVHARDHTCSDVLLVNVVLFLSPLVLRIVSLLSSRGCGQCHGVHADQFGPPPSPGPYGSSPSVASFSLSGFTIIFWKLFVLQPFDAFPRVLLPLIFSSLPTGSNLVV